MKDINDKKLEPPTPEDSWAQVELWRWQYGGLPDANDYRPLDVSKGLQGMANAIKEGDLGKFPTPYNVVLVLEYAAKLLRKD